MTAVFDTNVVLDVLLGRAPHVVDSAAAVSVVELTTHQGLLCADAITTIHYIARKQLGTTGSRERIEDLLKIFSISPVTGGVIASALGSNFGDFEDAVVHESAKASGADCIVTRNVGDFRPASLTIYSPSQFVAAT